MITIQKNQVSTIKIYLNQNKVDVNQNVSLSLVSPSRSTITLDKSLTEISQGFYSFELTSSESTELIDDTYSYSITQGEALLKNGYVRLVLDDSIITVFNYTLDFTLS